MNKDLNPQIVNSEYAYENMNLRMKTEDYGSGMLLTNEKGPKILNISGIENGIQGIPIGNAVINNKLILFSAKKYNNDILDDINALEETIDLSNITNNEKLKIATDYEDIIYNIDINNSTSDILYSGDLNFDPEKPIETLTSYENEELQKVYWLDGKNQLRVINIAANKDKINKWHDKFFDAVPELKLQEEVQITKNYNYGIFSSGVIQYAFTYFNLYLQETNIFYTSPLYYINYNDRGANAEEQVQTSFDITISNIDKHFDYIRVYSIHRTSINSTPVVKKVVDLPINNSKKVKYTDKGEVGEYIDPMELLYIGGEEVIFGSMCAKDSTLFLGDITMQKKMLSQEIKNIIDFYRANSNIIEFDYNKNIIPQDPTGYYPYKIQLDKNSSEIKTFKYLEYYRFGIQAQHKTGRWSEVLWLGDYQNDKAPKSDFYNNSDIQLASANCVFNNNFLNPILSSFVNEGYIKLRPVIVYPQESDRECICQGVLCPTVYNVGDRLDNVPYAQSSWFTRPNAPFQIKHYPTYPENNVGKYKYRLLINKVDALNASYLYGASVKFKVTKYKPKEDNKDLEVLSELTFIINNCYVDDLEIVGYSYIELDTDSNGELTFQEDVLTLYTLKKGLTPNYKINKIIKSYIEGSESDDNLKSKEYYKTLGYPEGYSLLSKAGIVDNTSGDFIVNIEEDDKSSIILNSAKYGRWAEFRHNYQIPINTEANSEIQGISDITTPYISYDPYRDDKKTLVETYKDSYKDYFFIDQNTVTFHTPEIDSLNLNDIKNTKLRIIGLVPLTANSGDINITTSTPTVPYNSETNSIGFVKTSVNNSNTFSSAGVTERSVESPDKDYRSNFGWRGLMSGMFYVDQKVVDTTPLKFDEAYNGYVIYPFHKQGSLTNQNTGDTIYSKLETKVLSNLRFSYKTIYINEPNKHWKSLNLNGLEDGGDINIFNSNQVEAVSLNRYSYNCKDKDEIKAEKLPFYYFGNIDKVLSYNNYPIISTGNVISLSGLTQISNLFNSKYLPISYLDKEYSTIPEETNELISMKYKSTPHIVINLGVNLQSYGGNLESPPIGYYTQYNILPTINENDNEGESQVVNPIIAQSSNLEGDTMLPFWDLNDTVEDSESIDINLINQDVLDLGPLGEFSYYSMEKDRSPQHGFLWLGELYRDNVINRFGGFSEEALSNNVWVPAGKAISLLDEQGKVKNEITLVWEEGDTYYQRYDHLKTYPFTANDQNGIVDIISFMCETRINLDGRWDKNRGLLSNLYVTPENFNLNNTVYNQQNNFFTYRTVNDKFINLEVFKYSLTWTKSKVTGSLVDNWLNITLASVLDLEGSNGNLISIENYNNSIYAFQENGISEIIYNPSVQMQTTDGGSVELANSGKVEGKRIISGNIGCSNKWSICSTPNGLYFMDTNNKNIYRISDKFDNLTDLLGMSSWAKDSINSYVWNPLTFKNFITYYDNINGDVLFISDNECLAYSEPLNMFTSFYSYEHTPYLVRIQDRSIFVRPYNNSEDDKYYLWEHNKGEYNNYFGKYYPFSTTIIANEDPTLDKIYDTLEFRSDSWDNNILLNETYDTLKVWNEYQSGISKLYNDKDKSSSLKRKFRIWKANIPRDKNGRDRMRNPWLFIKLSKEIPNNNKTVLNDLAVHYTY
jgi:hypothetical protein